MTLLWLVLGVVIAVIAHDTEVRRGLISGSVVRWAASVLPRDERARHIEQWSADLHDIPGALPRLFCAFDLFRAGASVRVQLVEQALSARVATATEPQECNVMNAVAVPAESQSLALSGLATGMPARLSIGVVLAIVVTTGLLWVMTYLIAITDGTPKPSPTRHHLDIIRVVPEPEPVIPPTLTFDAYEPPPAAPPRGRFPSDGNTVTIAMAELPPTDIPADGPTILDTFDEGDLMQLVAVRPVYPPRAEARGLEGSCTVQYTVTRHGTVVDPMVVKNQCTSSLFERASIDAALKFRYKPRVVNGAAVDAPRQMTKFTFVME